ncbi:helix-turn-helix domain-containing protein [Tardiphaga sp. 866_E4_N2_1]|jgi:AraC family transcriptional regulator|uniref:helix-turn-helix domain-containing protein n=1 Tax=unclassified Tardiphaga TaxID=2631404 RepID=UPI000B630EF0|nr:AraC family transcriptional regulator [Tardiphaga sp. OK246]SNT61796.1 AraC family transcriptional regulator [Tardiphaga sp. OK246]
MSNVSENGEFIRIVGGRVLSNTVVRTPVIRIESFRRDVSKQVQWHFKQPELALFFYRRGARKLRGKMDGKSFDQQLAGNLAVYPAGLEIDGEFTVTSARSDYTVVFFDQTFISERLPSFAAAPRLGFDNPAIAFGLEELCSEPHHDDDVYAMMAEGWATQTLAVLKRMSGTKTPLGNRGGLTHCNLKRISEFVEENLGRSIGLMEMASLVGLSTRHFIRAFSESTGDTPHQYVIGRRIERAKYLLISEKCSLTEVGLAVGFSHSQHFTTKFKQHTGLCPSGFRAAVRH